MQKQSNSTKGLTQKYKRLPKGILAAVAERHGVSKGYVTDVKAGRRIRPDILLSIVEELRSRDRQQKEVERMIENL